MSTLPKLTTLTDEEINVLIAEAAGKPKFTQEFTAAIFQVPDYCTDLNAMAGAEAQLTPSQREEYAYALYGNTSGALHDYDGQTQWDVMFELVTSTAKQRACAFLIAVGRAVQ